MNRLPPENNEEEVRRRLAIIADSACLLYDCMEPGMTISVELEEPQAIIAPGAAKKMRKLYITRPAMTLELKG